MSSPRYAGTFLGYGHPHAGDGGYAVDDPPEPAMLDCPVCGQEFSEDDKRDPMCDGSAWCPECADKYENDIPPDAPPAPEESTHNGRNTGDEA